MKMTGSKMGSALLWVGVLLVLGALALTAYNLWDDERANGAVQMVLEEIKRSVDAEGEPMAVPADVRLPVPDYILNPNLEMPAVEIDGYRYIGILAIPVLELELPVMEDWSYPQLKIAPCRYSGSAYQGNLILCAHNYTTHFGRLKNLLAEDEVIFTDMAGHTFNYTVAEVETLNPTAVEEMRSGGWDLTLFTCTIGGQTRVTVRCRASG